MSKPIAMRMNAEQLESIKPILEANGYECSRFTQDEIYYPYIVKVGYYDNTISRCSENHPVKPHEEFNAKISLNSLGIEYEEPQPTEQIERYNIFDKAQQLINDAKQQGVEIEIKEGVIILKQVVK